MKDIYIKNVNEKEVISSENNFQNQVEIFFGSKKDAQLNETITLKGEGSVKVLLPV